MRPRVLCVCVLLLATTAVASDLTGRAILSYQTYGTEQYNSEGFNQLYELRLQRQLTDPFRLRLSLRAEDSRGGTDFGSGRVPRGSTQLQPGGELLYTLPKFQAQALYDRTGLGSSGLGAPATDRTLTRRLGRVAWTPDGLPSFTFTSEKRGTADPVARLDQAEKLDQGTVVYTWNTLTAAGVLRRTALDDGRAAFARSAVERQGLVTQEGTFLGGRLSTSLSANVGTNKLEDRAGATAAAVPNPVTIAQARWVVDDTPLDNRDKNPISVPILVDGNLDAPTQIQLGPDGTSFQNLILDLGRVTDLDTIRVLVRDGTGQLLRFGGSLSWDVYVSTDGDRWTPVSGSASAFVSALSLYEVKFPSTRSRWFKVVSFATNAVDTRVSEVQAFFTTLLGPNDVVRTDSLLGSGTTSITYRPVKAAAFTYYGLFNALRQTSSVRPQQTNHGLDQLFGLELSPVRVMNLAVRYQDRSLKDSNGFDQSFKGWTGDLQFRFLHSLQQTLEASRLDENTAGRRNLTTSYALRTYTRFYDTWDLSLSLGSQQQDFAELGFRTERRYLGGVSQTQLTRALKLTLTASLQHTTTSGAPIEVRPQDEALPPERDQRWTAELFYRAGPQLGVSGRWGRAHAVQSSATIQMYHLDWYPFPGGSVRLGAQYDQDLDSQGERQARRLTLTPAWTINRHAALNVNYTFLGVTGPQDSNTRTFFVTLTVTM